MKYVMDERIYPLKQANGDSDKIIGVLPDGYRLCKDGSGNQYVIYAPNDTTNVPSIK